MGRNIKLPFITACRTKLYTLCDFSHASLFPLCHHIVTIKSVFSGVETSQRCGNKSLVALFSADFIVCVWTLKQLIFTVSDQPEASVSAPDTELPLFFVTRSMLRRETLKENNSKPSRSATRHERFQTSVLFTGRQTARNILKKKKEKDKKDRKIQFNPSLSANETSRLCLPNASQSVAPCSQWKTPRLPKAIADRYNKYSRHERRQLTGEGGG